jgi:H+/Cl- antiporter ClcA
MTRPSAADLRRRARRQAERWGFASVVRSQQRVWWLVVLVGLGSGLVGAGYVEVLKLVTRVLGPGEFGRPEHLLILTAVGLTIGVLTLTLGNPGDVELLVDNIHVTGGRSDIRELRSLIPVSLLGIAAGSAIGPEAPLVQTTGAIGTGLARHRGLEVSDTRVLTITGMAAGFTVLFGAPFGSAIFALEILHRRGLQYYEALLPAAIGSLSGYVVYAGVTGFGFQPLWRFPEPHSLRPVDFAVGVGAGVVGAALAIGFTWSSKVLRRAFRRLPTLIRPVVGGAALGGLAFLSPYALTFGEGQVQTVATAKLAVATLLVAMFAKLLASSMIASSGWRGGFIIPLFFVGVALGTVAHQLLGVDQLVAMAAAMVAVNVGVTKTPFGSSVVVAEMAGLRLLPPVLLAAIVALFLTSRTSMIDTQRERDSESSLPEPTGPRPSGLFPKVDGGLD